MPIVNILYINILPNSSSNLLQKLPPEVWIHTFFLQNQETEATEPVVVNHDSVLNKTVLASDMYQNQGSAWRIVSEVIDCHNEED